LFETKDLKNGDCDLPRLVPAANWMVQGKVDA